MAIKRIALLFGGKSPEHEVSIRSARNVYKAIDRSKYEVLLVGVSYEGAWYLVGEQDFQNEGLDVAAQGIALALLPGRQEGQIIRLDDQAPLPQIDACFPVIHGPNGEDGTLQGLFRHLNLPFVGPDVMGSAVAMDKDICKRLFLEANLLTADYLCFHLHEKDSIDFAAVRNRLGDVLFVKPANMGSSIGVSRADSAESFAAAIDLAFKFDKKIIIEEAIIGREIECAVLGNEFPEASNVGEISMDQGFYTYEAKYLSADAAKLSIPAKVSQASLTKIRMVARQAYLVLGCEGLSRVDIFLTPDDKIYLNEVNTLPGFTSISMYPQLWAHEGISYPDLIDKLIEFAISRFERDSQLQWRREG